MMSSKKLLLFLVVAGLMALVAACGGAAQTETVTVVETVVVEKEVQGETVTVVETVVVEKEVEVEKVVTVEVEKEVVAEAEDPDAGRITLIPGELHFGPGHTRLPHLSRVIEAKHMSTQFKRSTSRRGRRLSRRARRRPLRPTPAGAARRG